MQPYPFIFTFFSFKGGVGRTMAAVNTAYALASRGRDVLLVDMDIEAPGLSTFLRHQGELEGQSSGDMLDLLAWAKAHVRASDGKTADQASVADPAPNLSQFVAQVPSARIPKPRLGECGRLDVLAVHDDRDYVRRLRRLGLGLSGRSMVVALSRALRSCLRQARVSVDVPEYYGDAVPREKAYDYILVDSRTGLTEIGGLCVGPLADRLVVLVALNDQNVTWTERFLKTVGVSKRREEADKPFDEADPPPSAPQAPPRLGPKPTLIVASPVPVAETDLTDERLKVVEETLGVGVAAKLSYNALMALKETVFVRDYQRLPLAGEYRTLADTVMASVNDHAAQLAALFSVRWNAESQRAAAVDAALRLTPQNPDLGLGLLQALHDVFRPKTDLESIATDRMYRLLASSPSTRAIALNSWGVQLGQWSAGTPDPRLRGLRYREAMERFASVLEMPDASTEQKANALFNRGVAHGKAGRADLAFADYAAVIAMPDAPAELRASALVNRGGDYTQAGEADLAMADCAAVLAMPDAPPEQKAKALCNVGWLHYLAGRFAESAAASRESLKLDPSSNASRANLGLALLHLGRGEEAHAEYATALAQITSIKEVERRVVADLRDALSKCPDLQGAREILDQAEQRRRALASLAPAQ